jgi:hypothetical protein
MATRRKATSTTKKSTQAQTGFNRTLSARDLRINRALTPISLPELGGVVYKRELPASVMISRPAIADPTDPIQQQNNVSYFICKSIVDEDGNQIFDDSEAESLRDTLSIAVYVTLTQAVIGPGGALGIAGTMATGSGAGKGKGASEGGASGSVDGGAGTLPNAPGFIPTPSSGSRTS